MEWFVRLRMRGARRALVETGEQTSSGKLSQEDESIRDMKGSDWKGALYGSNGSVEPVEVKNSVDPMIAEGIGKYDDVPRTVAVDFLHDLNKGSGLKY